MLADLLLALHVTAGAAGLIAGPLGYLAARRAHVRSATAGEVYFAAVLVVAATALGLIAFDPSGLWWLAPLALLTAVLAWRGRSATRSGDSAPARAGRGGLGGSYIGLVTASLVVSFPGVALFWILPTVVGVAWIEYPALDAARLRWLAGSH